MAKAEIHFTLVNGDRPVLTIPEGEDVNEVLRNILHDPAQWIGADNETHVRKENVVSLTLIREPGPLVG